MRDTKNDPKYKGIDVLTELDLIADKINVSHISRVALIGELKDTPRLVTKPRPGILVHRVR